MRKAMPPIRRLGAIITRSNDGAVLSPQSIVGGIVLMPYSNASPARSLAGVLPVEEANQGFGVIVGHLSPRYRMTLLGAFRMSEPDRSEEHTSELSSLMRNTYAVICLK